MDMGEKVASQKRSYFLFEFYDHIVMFSIFFQVAVKFEAFAEKYVLPHIEQA